MFWLGIMFFVIGFFYFNIFGKAPEKVEFFEIGEVDKSSINSLNSKILTKNGEEITIPSKKLIIVEMTKQEEEKFSKSKDYYPNYIYLIDSKIEMSNSKFIPEIIKDFSYFKNYNDFIILQVDSVTYKNLKSRFNDIRYVKTLGIAKKEFNITSEYTIKEIKSNLEYFKKSNQTILNLKEDDLFYRFFFIGFVICYFLIILVLVIESKEEKKKRIEKLEFKKAKKLWKIPKNNG